MNREFLGRGWKFPLALDEENHFEMLSEEANISEAILITLNTVPGERVMRPEFGCGIHNYVFSIINNNNLLLIETEVKKALTLYEPRIIIDEVRVEPDESEGSKLMVNIAYTVLSSNSRFNMVYPFYLTENG